MTHIFHIFESPDKMNQENGLAYEKYVRDFIIEKLQKNAYLWNQCPENILIENNLISSHNHLRLERKDLKTGNLHSHKDIGIDVIQVDEHSCSIVQCKNGYKTGITLHNIAGIMMRAAFLKNTQAYIYYTDKLCRDIKYTAGASPFVKFIKNPDNIADEIDSTKMIYFVKLSIDSVNSVKETVQVDVLPEMQAYDYQTQAVETFKEHYTNGKHRGILSLPCGCGKTYTSFLISKQFDQIVILSPLRAFAEQNLKRYMQYGYDEQCTMLVDSDGIRDVNVVQQFIQDKQKCLISCTYKSMDIISECLDKFSANKTLFIVDEFHNISKTNLYDDTDPIFKLLMSDHRILFMSATPRIYDLEFDDDTYDMQWLFGDVVYNMSMTEAIQNKHICDYRIWLPSVHENNSDLDRELSIYEIDNDLKNRCKYLYSCLCNNGSRKCIIYCKDTEDMENMMKCMLTLNDFYYMNIEMNSISCESSDKQRKERLKWFDDDDIGNKIQLLFNIKILNECIDVPACDSVYISYPHKNKITTIQRICRANRKMPGNPYKVANIYIWCDQYDQILDILSSIKEFDLMFQDKIKINTVDFFHTNENKDIDLVTSDKALLTNYILGIKEFREIKWNEKLQMLKDFIHTNGKLPSSESTDPKIKQLGLWNLQQKANYKHNKNGMKNQETKNLWQNFILEHTELCRSNEEKWRNHLHNLEIYIQQNETLPSEDNKTDIHIKKLGKWCNEQKLHFKNHKCIMKYSKIREDWFQFTQKYPKLFMSTEEQWKSKLQEAELYIEQNKNLPSLTDKDENIKSLAKWLYRQNENYKDRKKSLEIAELLQLWEQFIAKHRFRRFMTPEEYWLTQLNHLEQFILKNHRLPSMSKPTASLKIWIDRQNKNYKKEFEIMKNENVRKHWRDFLANYDKFFQNASQTL